MQTYYSQPKALLFPITLQYETVQHETVSFTSLSKLTLLQLSTQFSNLPYTLKVNTIVKSLVTPTDISKLIFSDIDILYDKILEISVVSSKTLESITESLLVIEDPKYTTPEFQSCELCQKKGLDKVRNCPMIDERKHNKRIVPYTFKGDPNKLSKVCPMYDVNNSVELPQAIELLTMLELHSLPIQGGMLEQTVFVNEVSKIVKPIIDKKNIPMML